MLDTALAAKEFCDSHSIKAFVKTSGKTGIHFYIPCAGLDFPQARIIAERICAEIHQLAPESLHYLDSINSRGSKVYVDPSQNDYADTLAAPYSVRPYPNPTVSTPLAWKELNRRLDPTVFTMDRIVARVKNTGELFKGVLDAKIAENNTLLLRPWLG